MSELSDDAVGRIQEFFRRFGVPTNLCPECGSELRIRDGMHCSGQYKQGRRWTGGVDWAYCETCRRWFQMVYGPNHTAPRTWEPCEPPSAPPDLRPLSS
jgi:hypothetical protein